MHKLETLREAAEMIEDKIVQMCFETDPQVFVQWLRVMVGSATIEDDVILYQTIDGRTGGFDFRCDPSTKAVMVGFKTMSRGKWKKVERNSKSIRVKLSEIDRERLEAIATSRNLSLSELIRYWIRID